MTLTPEENKLLKTVSEWLGCRKEEIGYSVELLALAIGEAVSLNQVFVLDKLRIQIVRIITQEEFQNITNINDKFRTQRGIKRDLLVGIASVEGYKATSTEWGAKEPPSTCRFYYLAKEI